MQTVLRQSALLSLVLVLVSCGTTALNTVNDGTVVGEVMSQVSDIETLPSESCQAATDFENKSNNEIYKGKRRTNQTWAFKGPGNFNQLTAEISQSFVNKDFEDSSFSGNWSESFAGVYFTSFKENGTAGYRVGDKIYDVKMNKDDGAMIICVVETETIKQ